MRITISLPDELGEAVQARAMRERRSLSNLVALFIEDGMAAPVTATWTTAPPLPRPDFKGPDPKVKK